MLSDGRVIEGRFKDGRLNEGRFRDGRLIDLTASSGFTGAAYLGT
jgi:hypothetical protein